MNDAQEDLETRTKGMSSRAKLIITSVPMYLTHIATISVGIYDGVMQSNGLTAEVPSFYLLAANSLASGAHKSVNETPKGSYFRNYRENFLKGVAQGGIFSVLEYNFGKTVGFYCSRLFDIM